MSIQRNMFASRSFLIFAVLAVFGQSNSVRGEGCVSGTLDIHNKYIKVLDKNAMGMIDSNRAVGIRLIEKIRGCKKNNKLDAFLKHYEKEIKFCDEIINGMKDGVQREVNSVSEILKHMECTKKRTFFDNVFGGLESLIKKLPIVGNFLDPILKKLHVAVNRILQGVLDLLTSLLKLLLGSVDGKFVCRKADEKTCKGVDKHFDNIGSIITKTKLKYNDCLKRKESELERSQEFKAVCS
ncbi:PREDICTED: uncharacterized protein LOC108560765 [Nicrophorus vespilloides]|uniref:Uncharacterized protein LOC108560765 n=1 Tax=Nicrophorus vespilloides TaxID=110193 RepID=A0ABM1MH87_NICVS|nr:PREDICTED: uncharacterized protein LOC108560765 [Nicrophorus vespilloides]